MNPQLLVDLRVVRQNMQVLTKLCQQRSGRVFGVTKVFGGCPEVARALRASGVSGLADSRIVNLQRMQKAGVPGPYMLLRSPGLSEASLAVQLADISLNSDLDALEALSRAAVKLRRHHAVVLMVDMGDGREGVQPAELPHLYEKAVGLPHLKIRGIGANFACFAGQIPRLSLLEALVALRDSLGAKGLSVSAGSSSGLHLLLDGRWPETISEWRIGESAFSGRDIVTNTPIPGCLQDGCLLYGEVIECKGNRRLSVVALGRQEIGAGTVVPLDSRQVVQGVSSDHLLLRHPTRALRLGSRVGFRMDYYALMAAAASNYVELLTLGSPAASIAE